MKITDIVITAVSALSLVSALSKTPEEHDRGVLGRLADEMITPEGRLKKISGDFSLGLVPKPGNIIKNIDRLLGPNPESKPSFLGSESKDPESEPDVPKTQPDVPKTEPDVPETQPDVPKTDPEVGEPLVPDVNEPPVATGPKMACPGSIPFQNRGVCNGESCHMPIRSGFWKANFPCTMGTRCTGRGGGDGACCGTISGGVHARCPNGDWGSHGPPQFSTADESFLFVAPKSEETAEDVKKTAVIA